MDMDNNMGIIAPFDRIKKESLDAYYQTKKLLQKYRLMPENNEFQKMLKANVFLAFKSNLLLLYSLNKIDIQSSKRTLDVYEVLKELDKYELNVLELSYEAALKYFDLLHRALFKIGLLNISVSSEDSEDKIF